MAKEKKENSKLKLIPTDLIKWNHILLCLKWDLLKLNYLGSWEKHYKLYLYLILYEKEISSIDIKYMS